MLFEKYRHYLKHGNKVINKDIMKLSITDSTLLDCHLHHSTLFTCLFCFVLAAVCDCIFAMTLCAHGSL